MWSAVGYPLFGSRHFTAPHQSCLDAVRKSLGDKVFELAIARGAELSADQAVAYALEAEVAAPLGCQPPPDSR